MKKEDSKLHTLKQEFVSGRKLSNKDICELLNIKRTRVYDYINMLKKEGVSLDTETTGHITYYYMSVSPSESLMYEPISNKDILRFKILSILNRQPMSTIDLCRELSMEYSGADTPCQYSGRPSKTSTYYKEISEMLKEGMLIKLYSTKLFPSGIKYPLIINIDLESYITKVSKGQNQSDALRSIAEKVAILSGDSGSYNFDDSCFWQYGRGHHYDALLSKCFEELLHNHFSEKTLEFDYNGKTHRFHTGLLVYCQDKDTLYLIGHMEGEHGDCIINYQKIQNLTHTKNPNLYYGNPKYREYLANMFSISTEKAEEVEVSFLNTPENIRRLERLCTLRTNGKYRNTGDRLVYTDRISGLNDFNNYLRSFGNECIVIKPESLRKDMQTTLQNTLKKYGITEQQP